PASKLQRAFLDGLHDDALKLAGVLPWTDFVRMDIEQFNERFVIVLRQFISEETGGPKVSHSAEWQQRRTDGFQPEFLLVFDIADASRGSTFDVVDHLHCPRQRYAKVLGDFPREFQAIVSLAFRVWYVAQILQPCADERVAAAQVMVEKV